MPSDEIRPAFTDEGMQRFVSSYLRSIAAAMLGDVEGADALAAQTDAISNNPKNRRAD
jgi:hypothetical protein